jgi:hypothetical protein
MTVFVEYIGHPCFRVWRSGGPRIVLDAYTPGWVGLPAIELKGGLFFALALIEGANV